MSRLRAFFAPSGLSIQTTLFPWVEEELGALTEKQQQLVPTLEIIRVEDHLPRRFHVPGRPATDRAPIARACVAKAVYDRPTTSVLLDRLAPDVDVVARTPVRGPEHAVLRCRPNICSVLE